MVTDNANGFCVPVTFKISYEEANLVYIASSIIDKAILRDPA